LLYCSLATETSGFICPGANGSACKTYTPEGVRSFNRIKRCPYKGVRVNVKKKVKRVAKRG
jgi:hypothetical protein